MLHSSVALARNASVLHLVIKTPKVAPQKSLIINLYVLNTEKHGGGNIRYTSLSPFDCRHKFHKINDCLENDSNTQPLSFSLSHSHAVPVGHFMLCIMCFHVQSIFLRVLKQTLLMIHLTLDGDHAPSI